MRNAPDNNQWLQQFLAGEHLAFGHYFDLHYQSIFYIAQNILDDVQNAEDIVADSFAILWENHKSIRSEAHIAGFLKLVAKNLSLNYKKHTVRKKASEEELRYLEQDLDEADLERKLVLDELLKRVHKAVEELPPKCKEVFKLIFFEELTTKEVAERLGITERNVLNQKTIAKDRLKSLLSGKFDDP